MPSTAPARAPLFNAATVIGGFVLLVGVVSYFGAPRDPEPAPPPTVSLEGVEAAAIRPTELQIVLVGADGVERPVFRTRDVPDSLQGRLHGALEALRDAMIEEGDWPSALPAPHVFLLERPGRERTAVLNFPVEQPVRSSVGAELRVLASIERTLAMNGVLRSVVLRDGRPTETFLGNVALTTRID